MGRRHIPCMPQIDQQLEEAIETKAQTQLRKPPLFKVLLHNDHYTTMEFVVYVLVEVFRHNELSAIRIMLQVHQQGVGIAGIYPYEIAETKVARVLAMAKERDFPLLCTLEEEDGEGSV
jgi:ATP-dependent Clp protease adaptor protein ClpS